MWTLQRIVRSLPKGVSERLQAISLAAQVDDFKVHNEPCFSYLKESEERKALEASLDKFKNATIEIPIIIGGEEIYSGDCHYQVMPFDHKQKIAKFHWANTDIVKKGIEKSQQARHDWEQRPLSDRIQLFLRAADLVSGKYRMDLNAATMLGQGKTVIQAEIDAAAELADFFRFNAYFAKELTKYQPISTEPNISKNSFRHRGIEGFIASISPFNFTAIGGNLATAPTLMGNVVLWKPSDTAILSNYLVFKLLQEAGFPPGVINFIPAEGSVFGNAITNSPLLAGINFTGSVPTFRHLWKQAAGKLENYINFPRLVGECGGKNFHFVHHSADVSTVVASSIRSAFEYSGQKCSACSRMYLPDTLWPQVKEGLVETQKQLKLGSPLEYDTFLTSVIDEKAFKRISQYVNHAQNSKDLTIIAGGKCDNSVGYYIEPTIVVTTNPSDKIMTEEIFGPVLTIYVYPEKDLETNLNVVKETVPYGLTGAIFSKDEKFIEEATEKLKMAAGNFYINDKSTGSVVGQQPFGGGRLSGTNDKAGGPHYLLRWASPQVIKESFVPLPEWNYPYMKS